MRILALSDRVVELLYGPGLVRALGPVDVIIGCGDLPPAYLEYIVTQYNAPLLFVPGNHDADELHVPGGESIDGRVVTVGGVRIAGLGGSRRYKAEGRHQYTESQMMGRIAWLGPRLVLPRLRTGRGVDVLVAHAPPLYIHDAPDLTHTGFTAFRSFLAAFRPRLMLHGHMHVQRNLETTATRFLDTQVINVFPYRCVDVEAG